MVVGDVTTGTDVLIIGGGPGGYVAAIRAAQLDLEVMLVEQSAFGGTCLNHGCIPSKALISATDVAHQARTAEDLGVYADPAVDLQGMVTWKDRLVRRLTKGVESLCEQAGATLVTGRAEFAGPNRARIIQEGEGQGSETVEFEHAIVATGSRPIEIPGFTYDGEYILSSKGALALDSVPDRILIVGAGYIGMELATVFQKAGSDVTIIEQLETALPAYEADVTDVVVDRARELGIDFHFGQSATEWEEAEDGIHIWTEGDSGTSADEETTTDADNGTDEPQRFDADRCLVAVGREPVTDTLNLDAVDVTLDDRGFIETDAEARSSLDHIFAVGDVAGEPMLAHTAFAEGEVAAEVIAGEPAALDHRAIPAAVFTDPEIATVGMTEAEARDAGFEPVTGQMPMRASGRALTLGEREGFVRVVADRETEFILGGQIVAPEASELIAELSLAVELGATLEDVAATIHTHPTLSEAVHEAVKGARGESIHY